MTSDHQKQGQIDRAKRLREQIERLEKGEDPPVEHPSLREQIQEHLREIERKREQERGAG